jgi:hypothetical protein
MRADDLKGIAAKRLGSRRPVVGDPELHLVVVGRLHIFSPL